MNVRYLWAFLAVWALLFAVMRMALPARDMIQLLNGVFFGSSVGLVIAYAPLTYRALRSDSRYPDVRQFSLGRVMILLSVFVTFTTSVYLYSANMSTNSLTATALALRTPSGSKWALAVGKMPIRAGFCRSSAVAATSPRMRSARSASARTKPSSRFPVPPRPSSRIR